MLGFNHAAQHGIRSFEDSLERKSQIGNERFMSTTEIVVDSDRRQNPAEPQTVRSEPETAKPAASPKRWLMNPWFDLLLVGNVAWPLLLVGSETP